MRESILSTAEPPYARPVAPPDSKQLDHAVVDVVGKSVVDNGAGSQVCRMVFATGMELPVSVALKARGVSS